MERGRTFDAAAAAYDAHRSGYPSQLFCDLVALAKLKPKNSVLEIGCGSGQATAGFVAEGLEVTGVDPGTALVAIARQKFAGSAHFEVATFEEWNRAGRKYDVVAAAQSWHWVRADIGFEKAADALSPRGFIAIFGHTPVWSAPLLDGLQPAYTRSAPELWGAPPEAWYLPDGPLPDLIGASGRFGRVEHRDYKWRRRYTAAEFAAYLGTRSDHLLLPEARRKDLLARVQSESPDTVEADWVTNLYFAPLA